MGGREQRWRAARGVVAVAACALLVLLVSRDGDRATESLAERGARLFRTEFTEEQGLGPLFNEPACTACHLEPRVGGVGRGGLATVLRVGRLTGDRFDSLEGRGGPVARSHAVARQEPGCERAPGIPAGANVTSVRNTPPLFGAGLIDAVPDAVIRAEAVPKRDGVHGRPNLVRGRIGRFGWKAHAATLEAMVAEALRSELGVTSPGAPAEPLPILDGRCAPEREAEATRGDALALTAFVGALPSPPPPSAPLPGARVFRDAGCAACHVPQLSTGEEPVRLYSDLLLHDMGPSLDDGVRQGEAGGADWRTTPLWGLGDRARFLHDGRAEKLEAAILAHGGEAATAQRRFRALTASDRFRLLEFLRSL